MSVKQKTLGDQRIPLLAPTTITDAAAGTTTTPVVGLAGMKSLTVQAALTYGSGGTSIDVWVQTSLDGGVTWCDVIQFSFTTASARKVSTVVMSTALAAAVTPTDGTLGANLILSGLLGDQLRLKYTTVGTYGGSTSLRLDAVAKG